MKKLIPILLFLICTSCTHLMYQPYKEQIYDPSKAGVTPEDVFLKNGEGKSIHGWYLKNRAKEKTRGMIVFFHGNGQNLSSHFATLMWIIDYGYDYVIFDYEGYWKSEGTPTPENTVEDGKMYIEWASQKAAEKKIPLIVYGESLGGAVALESIVELKGKVPISTVIINSSFLSYKQTSRKILSRHWLTWPFQWAGYLVLSDKKAPGDKIKEISPIPLLVIHGTKDQVIDYELGENLFETALEPKEFWKIEEGTHIDAFWRDKGSYRRK